MTTSRAVAAATLLTFFAGCTESTMIRSSPTGAKVYVNDGFIGVTPTLYSVPSAKWPGSFRCRVEADGYLPHEGELKTRPLPGRITGAVFTLGIVALFRRPVSFDDFYDFALQPDPKYAVPIAPARDSSPAQSVEERLRRAQDLRDRGLITKDEYEQRKSEILRGL